MLFFRYSQGLMAPILGQLTDAAIIGNFFDHSFYFRINKLVTLNKFVQQDKTKTNTFEI